MKSTILKFDAGQQITISNELSELRPEVINIHNSALDQLISWIERDAESLNDNMQTIGETIAYLATKIDNEKGRDKDRLNYLIMSLGYFHRELLNFKPIDNNY